MEHDLIKEIERLQRSQALILADYSYARDKGLTDDMERCATEFSRLMQQLDKLQRLLDNTQRSA